MSRPPAQLERTFVDSWWEALGKQINDGSYTAAVNFCVEVGCHDGDTAKICMVLDVVCREIRHDNPQRAMDYARSMLDLTGAYRLLATLVAPTDADRVDDLLALLEELR